MLTAGADASSVGIGTRHLLEAVRAEFEDQVDLPPLPDIEDALTVAGVRTPGVGGAAALSRAPSPHLALIPHQPSITAGPKPLDGIELFRRTP